MGVFKYRSLIRSGRLFSHPTATQLSADNLFIFLTNHLMPIMCCVPVSKALLLAFLLLGLLDTSVRAETYELAKEYSGPGFFNEWSFYDHYDDLTNGDANFVGASQASSDRLAYVDSSTNRAIIKVDNISTVTFNGKRNTVRIQTKHQFDIGSVWTVDMYHVPYGCSVWPAFWSHAPDWPNGGEIDTFEGVNLQPHNQMGLHTQPGCQQQSPSQDSSRSFVNSTDCSYLQNNNQGCTVTDLEPASYGATFFQVGGGVWVTELAESGISIWFMPRASVPNFLSSGSSTIDTSHLGTPVGNWPISGCDINKFFGPQNLIFDITLCGDFAKPPNIFSQTCPGVCYNDWVLGNGSNYADAYFDIASVRVFSRLGTNTVIEPSGNTASRINIHAGGATALVATLLGVGLTFILDY